MVIICSSSVQRNQSVLAKSKIHLVDWSWFLLQAIQFQDGHSHEFPMFHAMLQPARLSPVDEACVAVLSSALFGNGWASGLSRRLTMILEQTLRSPCNAYVCIYVYLIYIIYINTYTYVSIYLYIYYTQHTPIHCTTIFFCAHVQ